MEKCHQILWFLGFPGGVSGKKNPACQCRRHKRHGFDPWVEKIRWRRASQPAPVFLPGASHGQRSLAGYRHGVAKSPTWLKWLNMHTPVVLVLKPLRSLSSFTFSLWSSIWLTAYLCKFLSSWIIHFQPHWFLICPQPHQGHFRLAGSHLTLALIRTLFLLCSWILAPPQNWSVTCSETLSSSPFLEGIFLAHNSLS